MSSRVPAEKGPHPRTVPPLRGVGAMPNNDPHPLELARHHRNQWDFMGYPRPESLMEGIMYDMVCLQNKVRPADQLPKGLESDRLCDNVG